MAARASAISRETLETLKGMKTILGDNLSVAADLKTVLDQMYDPIEKSEKVLKDWGDSLHHVADFVSDGIDKFKQLNALTMRIHRLDAEDVKNKEKSIKLILVFSFQQDFLFYCYNRRQLSAVPPCP